MTDNELEDTKRLAIGQHIIIKCPAWVVSIAFVENDTFIEWLNEAYSFGLVYVHPLRSNDGAIFRKWE